MFNKEKIVIQLHHQLINKVEENSALLLMLQHFNADFRLVNSSLKEIAKDINVSEHLLLAVANTYCGFKPHDNPVKSKKDLKDIVYFLKNSHEYYRNKKYPEILELIKILQSNHPTAELQLLEKFYNEYFQEVVEHLDYEEHVAFPYFLELIENGKSKKSTYSSEQYSEHHTDIELKLRDLKSLILKHIHISGDFDIRRKLLLAILELEYDLYIHSMIEDSILIPIGKIIEEKGDNGIIS